MKKSCLDCKALNISHNFCELGYKTTTYDILGITAGVKPLEECPKPKTIKKYVNLSIKKSNKI